MSIIMPCDVQATPVLKQILCDNTEQSNTSPLFRTGRFQERTERDSPIDLKLTLIV